MLNNTVDLPVPGVPVRANITMLILRFMLKNGYHAGRRPCSVPTSCFPRSFSKDQ